VALSRVVFGVALLKAVFGVALASPVLGVALERMFALFGINVKSGYAIFKN
jgi:hypothetical protein